MNEILVQGRSLSPRDVSFIVQFIADHPDWSRRKLSQQLCIEWQWYNATGQMKDMACRTMLLKLEKHGHLVLPPRRQQPVNRMQQKSISLLHHDTTPIACSLHAVQKLEVINLWQKPFYDEQFSSLLNQYHYLGYKGVVGENMKYLIRDCRQRVVACLLFGSSAWKVKSRDTFIGWCDKARRTGLMYTTNNMRFLILPWIRIDNLASHILSLIARRIDHDWHYRYGHGVYLLETFVERERFQGTCYKAANWIRVGNTTGRTRNDRYSRIQVPTKDIYLYPLCSDYQARLCAIH